jgi:elongation factor Ts
MGEITASLVKELREKSGAGMMDCKKALIENNGDFEASVDWLRKKGLSSAAKKAGRIAAEGLIAALVKPNKGVVIELNSETDFVARNEVFQGLARTISEVAIIHSISNNDIEQLKKAPYPETGRTIENEVAECVAIIGENMNLRRVAILSVNEGAVISYVHNSIVPNLGKIGVLVALESSADKDKLAQLGKQLAMHIAASNPTALTSSEVDPESLEREKQIFSDQARASGKPENIIEKMVEGRIRKFYEEVVLLEQVFVIDGKSRISEVIDQASKDFGTSVKIKAFVRFALGEGIEQEQKNFADEVAAARG